MDDRSIAQLLGDDGDRFLTLVDQAGLVATVSPVMGHPGWFSIDVAQPHDPEFPLPGVGVTGPAEFLRGYVVSGGDLYRWVTYLTQAPAIEPQERPAINKFLAAASKVKTPEELATDIDRSVSRGEISAAVGEWLRRASTNLM